MKIVRPVLLLDETKCRNNIRTIAQKARKAGVNLRPHFKTHQCKVVGEWIHEEGIETCTVSSVRMAAYFADHGWRDITIAFPLNFLEIDEINRLAGSCKLTVLAVSVDGLKQLTKKLRHPVSCMIEVDTGDHRTGIDPTDLAAIDPLVKFISAQPLLTFKGFLTHAGRSYKSTSTEAVLKVHLEVQSMMKGLCDRYRAAHPGMEISVGDTPTASVATDFSGIDELRPGNFVFYDLMQRDIGACTWDKIAIAMACPIVAIYPERNEVIVHGGGVHFSKDFLRKPDQGQSFGEMVKLTKKGWESPMSSFYLKSLSQEHGIFAAPSSEIEKIKVGDVLGVLPVHACMTADAMGEYMTLDGKMLEMMGKAG
jgi:D-serine deaminase-like pyridoxal phosphate-dependent protein